MLAWTLTTGSPYEPHTSDIFIESAHAKRLDQVSAYKGRLKVAVIAAARASFLSPDGDDQREATLAKRLDRFSRQFDRLKRD